MRSLLVVLVIACGGQPPPPVSNKVPSPPIDAAPPDEYEVAMRVLSMYSDDMCACQDARCAQRVTDSMSRWAVTQTKPAMGTDEQQKRATAIGEHMGQCMQNAMAAGFGSTTP